MKYSVTRFIEFTVSNRTFYKIMTSVDTLKEYIKSKYEGTNFNNELIVSVESVDIPQDPEVNIFDRYGSINIVAQCVLVI
jgi:hypothetical protein